jgi:hypothetical protein
MKIVNTTPFPELKQTKSLLAIANGIARVVDDLIPGDPPHGDRAISLVYGAAGPMTFWEPEDFRSSRYRVRLSFTGAAWQQFAYQLSHELGHIKLGAARSNSLLETLAVAVSIRTLELLVDDWPENPPFPWDGWRDYAAGLKTYVANTRSKALGDLPLEIRDGFTEQPLEERLRRLAKVRVEVEKSALNTEVMRAWQHAAVMTLPWDKFPWKDLLGLATHTDPSPDDDIRYRHDLSLATAKVPDWVPKELR